MPAPPRRNGGDSDPSDYKSDWENQRKDQCGKGPKKPNSPDDNDPPPDALVKIMSVALGETQCKPADPPFSYKHLDDQDVKV